MTYARASLISLTDTPYYHVVARCVRRAWLCGVDEYAGRNYSHRKTWVLERLRELASTFAIDVCAYAVMSNHYHLVLHIDRTRALRMTSEEVVRRWSTLFSASPVVQRWLKGEAARAEAELVDALIATWRVRLHDISWFMKCLNEQIQVRHRRLLSMYTRLEECHRGSAASHTVKSIHSVVFRMTVRAI